MVENWAGRLDASCGLLKRSGFVTFPRAVLEAFSEPVFVVRDAQVRWVNGAAARLLERAPEDLEGAPFPELLADPKGSIEARLRSETGAEVHRVRLKTASESVVELDVRAGNAGEEGYVLFGHDATSAAQLQSTIGLLSRLYERRHSAHDIDGLLQESEAIFDALSWHVGLFELDGDHAILRATSTYAREGEGAGAKVAQLAMGRRVPLEVIPNLRRVVQERKGTFVEAFPAAAAKLAERIGVASREVAASLMKDRLERAAFAPVFLEERVAFVLVVVGPDLIERDFAAIQLFAAILSATEQARRMAEEMSRQQQHATLGQMCAQLAHEVRNPLAVMLQAARHVRKRLDDPEAIEELVRMIEEEGRRLDRLVGDLVHFAGPSRARRQPTYLEQVVRWSLELLLVELPQRCEQVTIEVVVDPDVRVYADPVLLRQAVAHLLLNACVHAGRDGRVDVEAEVTEDEAILSVRNDGEPLTPDVAARAFEPFFTTRAEGSGLGLAVVRRLVEDQGGRVTHDATDDGVCFSLRIPLAQ